MKKTTKIFSLIAGILTVAIVAFFIIIHVYTTNATKDIHVQTTDATDISDGVYKGSYEIESVKVSVQVTVEDEQITDIVILEHQNGLGDKAESIIDDIIENQSLEVDEVSGATASSKTILKAVENALQSGKN